MKIKIFPLAILLLLLTIINAYAAESMNWFIRRTDDHSQPELMGSGQLYEEYGVKGIGSPDEKVIYLTFDSGYENGNVAKILDTLKKHEVKSAFFILPAMIKLYPDIVKRMHDEGHIVANHSWSHKNISNMTKDELKSELTKLEQYYSEETGFTMAKYFRPPEGSFSEESLKYLNELGYRTVFWSFAYADWDNNKQKSPEWALDKILSNVHNGMVMLLHPNSATNAAILDELITKLKEDGYRFETLDHLYANSN